jgi:predicted nucleic acid-binding protein
MRTKTLFSGNLVVVDAMVVINFHGLLALKELLVWAKEELVVEARVRKEARFSKAGPIDLAPYIKKGSILEEEIKGVEQETLFYEYLDKEVGGARIHEAEAACLALAISKGYGLASDERVVREEFKKSNPAMICVHSWDIVDRARRLGFVSTKEANDLKRGLYYV